MSSPTEESVECTDPSRKHRRLSAMLKWCVAGVVGGTLLLATVIVLICMGVIKPGPGVDMRVEAPPEVRVGEAFQLSIVVRNRAKSKSVVWTGIEVNEDFAQGDRHLSIQSSTPSWNYIDYESGSHLFRYEDIEIPPLSEKRVTLTLQANKSGTFTGWMSAMIRSPFDLSYPAASSEVQTIVSPAVP